MIRVLGDEIMLLYWVKNKRITCTSAALLDLERAMRYPSGCYQKCPDIDCYPVVSSDRSN